MWDEEDYASRWVQLLCGIGLLAFAVVFGFLIAHGFGSASGGYGTVAEGSMLCGAAYLAVRCLWYAVTGKDNINRDDF